MRLRLRKAGGRFLSYLRDVLAYREGLAWGKYILSHIPELKKEDKYSLFMLALGWMHDEMGNARKAIEHLQQAYDIFREFYGDEHPHTRTAKRWLDKLNF